MRLSPEWVCGYCLFFDGLPGKLTGGVLIMRLMIGDQFLESFIQLPRGVQKKVNDFQKKFRANRYSHAINLESITTFKDSSLRTARVNLKYHEWFALFMR